MERAKLYKTGDESAIVIIDAAILETSNKFGLRSWRGSFRVIGGDIPLEDVEFQLELKDGRKGNILINRKSFQSGIGRNGISARFEFLGNGPLE